MEIIKNYKKVGRIDPKFALMSEFKYSGDIYMAPGVKRHIIKRHSHELASDILDNLVDYIEIIIKDPDYVGRHNTKEVGTSMEYIKKIGDNLLLSIEVDLKNNYVYVSSLYPITDSKIQRKLQNGKLKKV